VTLQKPQSDRYFIEVTSSCSPPSSEPITYTVNVTGPFGTPPKLAQGTAQPSLSIDAGPPLHGATSYIGTVQSNYADNWYGLIKKNDVTPATIRVENTTIKSSACSSSSLTVAFRDTNGDWLLGGGSPGSNKAIVEPIVGPGTYEIELTTSCDSGGVTYRIEAEPASEWVTTPVVHQSLPTGPSQASAGGPLAPKIAYTGLAPAVNTTIYAKFAYSGTTSGTAQVLNTTPVLNPAQPPCGTVRFNIVDPNQAILLDGTPPMNHGYTISLGVPGTYYVTATTEPTSTSCPPSVRQHVLVRLTGTTPPRVAAEDLHISPPEQALIKNYEGVAGSGGKPVPKPYKDATGNCTVGWGHKLHNGPCTASERATTYNMAQIVQFWTQDIAKAESRIKSAVPTLPLLQQEFDALGDFAFNLGAICGTGFETLCADLKAENYSAVPAAFLLYVKGTVKGIKGKVPFCNLYQRRTDEGQTWTSADYNRDYPSCPSGYR